MTTVTQEDYDELVDKVNKYRRRVALWAIERPRGSAAMKEGPEVNFHWGVHKGMVSMAKEAVEFLELFDLLPLPPLKPPV